MSKRNRYMAFLRNLMFTGFVFVIMFFGTVYPISCASANALSIENVMLDRKTLSNEGTCNVPLQGETILV